MVVKTWFDIQKNMRNFLPAHLLPAFEEFTDKWPAEIEAGLLLDGGAHGNVSEQAYVPARDYFILDTGSRGWQWAMVTPLIEGSTLSHLAESTKAYERTPQKLDKVFRPVFNRLLEQVAKLH